ncbi:MAG: hypothetical protein ACLTDF_09565 [Coprococcus sp.]
MSLVIMYACVRARFSMVRLHIGDLWKFKGAVQVVRIGMPSFLRQGLMCVAAVLLSRSCRRYGDTVLANITVANKILRSYLPFLWDMGRDLHLCADSRMELRRTEESKISEFHHGDFGGVHGDGGRNVISVGRQAVWSVYGRCRSCGFSLRAHAVSMPFSAVCLVMGMYYQALGAYGKATLISALRQGVFFIPHMAAASLVWRTWCGYSSGCRGYFVRITALVFWFICQRTFRTQMKNSQCR